MRKAITEIKAKFYELMREEDGMEMVEKVVLIGIAVVAAIGISTKVIGALNSKTDEIVGEIGGSNQNLGL